MNLPKQILVPTDFSPCADEALDYAVALAEKLGAKVIVMHAYEIPVVGFPDGAYITGADEAARILTATQENLDALIAKHERGAASLKGLLKNGEPSESIVAAARDVSADLIVMGTHGRRGLAHALLGSVAERVVRSSPCPVLTLGAQTVRPDAVLARS
ncbi:universal stress protein [Pendulispora brunnea]|uniref:Universal stress protein n=1 Tax=Pendulispora brunnea TaxID=2905690 RepID=A0ABZ2K3I7_9BACT